MKKKLLVGLLATTAALCCAFGLSACGDTPDNGGNNDGDDTVVSEHNLIAIEENKATCTADGNIAYYICEDCGKWFSDKSGKNEITDKMSVVTYNKLIPVAAKHTT